MKLEGLSAEKIIDRWEDHRAVQNLMGKVTYYYLLKQQGTLFADLWSTREDVCLGVNEGYYVGKEAVAGYYAALHEETVLRTQLTQEHFPDQLAGKSEEELFGVGSMDYKPLSSDLIEIAADGQTAKGMWMSQGSYDKLLPCGPLAFWTWSCYAADFVKENGEWRIWHLLWLNDIDCPCGEDWTKEPRQRPTIDCYARMGEIKLPAPTVQMAVWEPYHVNRPFRKLPRIPEEYNRFEETFSYGYEKGAENDD